MMLAVGIARCRAAKEVLEGIMVGEQMHESYTLEARAESVRQPKGLSSTRSP